MIASAGGDSEPVISELPTTGTGDISQSKNMTWVVVFAMAAVGSLFTRHVVLTKR